MVHVKLLPRIKILIAHRSSPRLSLFVFVRVLVITENVSVVHFLDQLFNIVTRFEDADKAWDLLIGNNDIIPIETEYFL